MSPFGVGGGCGSADRSGRILRRICILMWRMWILFPIKGVLLLRFKYYTHPLYS
jgi:hypothetical protein